MSEFASEREALTALEKSYRNSDECIQGLYVDIFLIPCFDENVLNVSITHFNEIHSSITREIMRYTAMSFEDAREFHSNNELEIWFGDDVVVGDEVYSPFYARYDIPIALLKKHKYIQGPRATFEVTI